MKAALHMWCARRALTRAVSQGGVSACFSGDWTACEAVAASSADLQRLLTSPPAPLLIASPSQQVTGLKTYESTRSVASRDDCTWLTAPGSLRPGGNRRDHGIRAHGSKRWGIKMCAGSAYLTPMNRMDFVHSDTILTRMLFQLVLTQLWAGRACYAPSLSPRLRRRAGAWWGT